MDRQKLIALVFAFLMISSSVAYFAAFIFG